MKVTTNYGKDTKDVKITVESKKFPLYVIGSKAEVRSEGAEAMIKGEYDLILFGGVILKAE